MCRRGWCRAELEGAVVVVVAVERLSKVAGESDRGGTVAVADHEDDVGLDVFWRPGPVPHAVGEVRGVRDGGAREEEQDGDEDALEHFEEHLALCETAAACRGVGVAMVSVARADGLGSFSSDMTQVQMHQCSLQTWLQRVVRWWCVCASIDRGDAGRP